MQIVTSTRIANDIASERRRQDAKWGEQNHPPAIWIAVVTEEVGEAAEACLKWEFGDDEGADARMRRFREELVHVAAVAIAALESVDRQTATQAVLRGEER